MTNRKQDHSESTEPSIETASLFGQLDREHVRDYFFSALPSPLDDEVTRMLKLFASSSAQEQRRISAMVTEDYSYGMLAFAERMATLAVRETSGDRVFWGLVAIVLEDRKIDWREDLLVLSLLDHSALKIGEDPIALFERAATLGSPEIARLMMDYVRQPARKKRIEAMGYHEAQSPEGFRYEREW